MKIFKYTIYLIILSILFASGLYAAARPDSQKGIYSCSALTGGAQGALDSLDQTGDGDSDITDGTPNRYDLIEGDAAIVITISGTTVIYYSYAYDADGTDAESSPDVIRPDDFATAGVWRLAGIYGYLSSTGGTASGDYNFGSGALFIDDSADFVGIGTDSPLTPLTVTDGSTPESMGVTNGIAFQGDGSAYFIARDVTNNIQQAMGVSSLGVAFVGSMTSHDVEIRTGNADRVLIEDGENLAVTIGADDNVDLIGNLSTPGVIKGRAEYGTDITASTSHDTTECHGVFYHFTAAATITLDAAADAGYGAQVCYRIRDASEAAVIDVDASEKINLAGTALAAGTAITATGAGESVCMVATTDTDGSGTDGWEAWGPTSGWASE